MTSVTIDMSGRVALVTGGSYGMGRASARRFASCGAQLAIADRPEASRDPARPASATAMLPSTPASSGVFRA